ncbi:MAG TPA: histidine kinase dimerization/phospho-acceptor domain-containing protein, partial [Virgibacillus sp.]|nr:histidine kinase dimerization/phospho-acceptor domain-containing protein [Virgibacillus sp.]
MISQNHSQENKENIATVDLNNGDIVIVRTPNPHYKSYEDYMFMIMNGLGMIVLVFHILLILFMVVFAFTTSKTFGKPIIYFLKWIERLSKNNFTIPEDHQLRKKSSLKRKYKMYEEIDQSLGLLTEKLKADEIALAQMEEKRKRWITGLSHDLKTPLSTIYGYANMLASGHEWTDEEIEEIGYP